MSVTYVFDNYTNRTKKKIRLWFEVQETSDDWFEGKRSNTSATVTSSEEHAPTVRDGNKDVIEPCKPKVILLIIDPQVDFHPEGGIPETSLYHPEGIMSIPGANEDSYRIKRMIEDNWADIDEIFVTLETRHKLGITSASSWTHKIDPEHPEIRTIHPQVGTVITHKDVEDGVWIPSEHLAHARAEEVRSMTKADRKEKSLQWCLYYTTKLEQGNRKLVIQPEHCLVSILSYRIVYGQHITVSHIVRANFMLYSSVHYFDNHSWAQEVMRLCRR
jgi:hypothetical protein